MNEPRCTCAESNATGSTLPDYRCNACSPMWEEAWTDAADDLPGMWEEADFTGGAA